MCKVSVIIYLFFHLFIFVFIILITFYAFFHKTVQMMFIRLNFFCFLQRYEVPAYEMDAFGGCRRRMSNPLYVAPKSLVHKETVSDMFASVNLEETVDS